MKRFQKQYLPLLTILPAILHSPSGETSPASDGTVRSETELRDSLPGWSAHPTGFNPFRRNTRSPSGLLYPNAWQPPAATPVGEDGWTLRGAFDAGLIGSSDDRDVASFAEYGDWEEGLTLHRFWYLFEQPESGAYVEGSGGALGRDDQHLRLAGGKRGSYEIAGFFNTLPHRFSSNARVLWDGAGGSRLTLPASLDPGNSTAGQVASAFESIGRSTLELEREKFGVSFRATPSRGLELFGRVSTEARDGARAFGGTFSYPGLGQVMELVEPVNYTTTDLSAGLHFSGARQQFNLRYTGSHFRNDTQSLTWENPGLSLFPTFTPPSGRYALAPDNDYRNIKADFATSFDFWRARLTATASASQSRQDAALLPPTIGSGVVSAAGMEIDLDLWNSTAALSRASADAAIDHLLGNVRLVLQPTRKLRLSGELRYLDEDNETSYTALNPQTGQYGYIALDGGLAAIIPTRSAVFDPNLRGSRVRIRNAPFEKDEMSAELGADYRFSSATKIGLSVARQEFDYTYRERSTVTDDIVRVELTQRGIPRGSLRIGYEWLQRDGSEYISNPYEAIYSSSLPDFLPRTPGGQIPHALSTLRKYDLADRESRSLDAKLLLVLTDTADLSLNARWEDGDLEADFGLREVERTSLNAEWSYRLGINSSLYLYYATESSNRSVSNITDAGPVGTDPAPGGVVYPLASAWNERVADDNRSAGGGFTRTFERFALDVQYVYSRSDTNVDYDFASPDAFYRLFSAAEAGTGFPQLKFDHQMLQIGLDWHVRDDLDLRVTYRYEREDLEDFHFAGLTDPLVANAIYLAAYPENFSAQVIGVFLQKSF